MTPQKKQMNPRTKLNGHKVRHVRSKSSEAVRAASRRAPSQTVSFKRAVERSIAAAKRNGSPVAKYDMQRRQAYLEYPDGKRTYVE